MMRDALPDGFGLLSGKGKSLPPSTLGVFKIIPYVIFVEILIYLSPLHLLQLAMVSKGIRAALRSDEANYIWKQISRCTFFVLSFILNNNNNR